MRPPEPKVSGSIPVGVVDTPGKPPRMAGDMEAAMRNDPGRSRNGLVPRMMSETVPRDVESNRDRLEVAGKTAGGIPLVFRVKPALAGLGTADAEGLRLCLEHARLGLLRGFAQLLCLEGFAGVEHLPHQLETVRKVLRHFRGRVLLADEVGLGKTIEACLILREYLLRGLIRRVLILVPPPLVSQWQEELRSKFALDF